MGMGSFTGSRETSIKEITSTMKGTGMEKCISPMGLSTKVSGQEASKMEEEQSSIRMAQ